MWIRRRQTAACRGGTERWTWRKLLVQEVRAGSKKLVMVLICVPPSRSASLRQPRAATAAMRAARLTRRQAAGNRFSAGVPGSKRDTRGADLEGARAADHPQ